MIDAQASGDLPADEPTAAIARTLWASLHGLAVLGERGGLAKLALDDTPERLVDDLLALTLR
ncbi:WHG domain-containing protein [Cellulomonas sp. JZ18]|uniref:WHG domain-containing protein n=1 Tax=Cellulomonas sp. JZ18 TaxID=2654191 RepID=UPI001E48A28D|nr:WHG domain-containing protein [Cellulomonas sp. JZ18]